ncbi:hypothetical protein [Pantoea sp. EEL5]|uniref:hypothetical protein n=1 Tax=Pantoea sp. EEL5 TaxID=3416806 RepID=UPI003CF86130
MSDAIVSVISPKNCPMRADRWKEEDFDIEYLDIEIDLKSLITFNDIPKFSALNAFIDGEDAGFYTLIVKSSERYVLAKGEIDKLYKN